MIKVLETKVENNEVWLKVSMVRNTDVLSSELFTSNDIEEAKKQGVREFMNKIATFFHY